MNRNHKPHSAISLVELVISIVLLGLVITGFYGIEVFSRYHLLTSDRRAKLQNEVSFLVEHMSKNLVVAMGDFDNSAVTSSGGTVTAYVDENDDGIRDTSVAARIRYCYGSNDCGITAVANAVYFQAGANAGELLVRRVTNFAVALDATDRNLLVIDLSACWDPAETNSACGSSDNPSIALQTTIRMPSVSVN